MGVPALRAKLAGRSEPRWVRVAFLIGFFSVLLAGDRFDLGAAYVCSFMAVVSFILYLEAAIRLHRERSSSRPELGTHRK
jgi:hypothetical protein